MKRTKNLERIAKAYPLYQQLIDSVAECPTLTPSEVTTYQRELRLEAFRSLNPTPSYTDEPVLIDSASMRVALLWYKTTKGVDFWSALANHLNGLAV